MWTCHVDVGHTRILQATQASQMVSGAKQWYATDTGEILKIQWQSDLKHHSTIRVGRLEQKLTTNPSLRKTRVLRLLGLRTLSWEVDVQNILLNADWAELQKDDAPEVGVKRFSPRRTEIQIPMSRGNDQIKRDTSYLLLLTFFDFFRKKIRMREETLTLGDTLPTMREETPS